MLETQEAMRMSDLKCFKSMFETLSPFSNPNLDSLFPQPVLPSDVSLPTPPPSAHSVHPQPTIHQIDQDPDNKSPTSIVFSNDDEAVVSKNVLQESKTVVQSLRCEICHIDCNGKSVLEIHLSGKRHKRNLQTLGKPSAAGNDMTNEPRITQSIRCGDCDVDCNSREMYEKHLSGKKHQRKVNTHIEHKNKELQVPHVDCSKDLEEKAAKLLDSSLPANSMKVCTICNIGCNSQETFDKHLAGKKQAAQVCMRSQTRELLSVKRSAISTARGRLIFIPNENASSSLESTATGAKPVQFAYCDVCEMYFNSSDTLGGHKLGTLHLKNLEKLALPGTENTNSSGLAVKPVTYLADVHMENLEACQVNSIDLKRKNTDQPGITVEDTNSRELNAVSEQVASKGSGTGCTICNIVCNSQTVLNSHLSGQKHAAMVKRHTGTLLKNARANIISEGPLAVSAS